MSVGITFAASGTSKNRPLLCATSVSTASTAGPTSSVSSRESASTISAARGTVARIPSGSTPPGNGPLRVAGERGTAAATPQRPPPRRPARTRPEPKRRPNGPSPPPRGVRARVNLSSIDASTTARRPNVAPTPPDPRRRLHLATPRSLAARPPSPPRSHPAWASRGVSSPRDVPRLQSLRDERVAQRPAARFASGGVPHSRALGIGRDGRVVLVKETLRSRERRERGGGGGSKEETIGRRTQRVVLLARTRRAIVGREVRGFFAGRRLHRDFFARRRVSSPVVAFTRPRPRPPSP